MSHCGYPIRLTGFTPKGEIKYRQETAFGDEEKVLSIDYTDRKWITYKKALRPKHNPLNQWIGEKVIRIQPTKTGSDSFMKKTVRLVSASKHHVVVGASYRNGIKIQIVLGFEFTNPEDWVLANDIIDID